MPSTYTSNNKIQKIATGEQSGTWGNTTNTNFDLFDTAIDGFVSVTLSGTTHTLNIPDGSAGDGRNKVLVFTGTLAATNTVSVTPNTVKKHYYVQNNTTGGQSIIISQGSGSTVTVKNGYSSIVYLDGAGSSAAVKEVLTSLKLTALLEATGAVLNGSSSGSTTLQASATASGTLTLPAATDTLVGKATTDTFTNKTFDTAGAGNVLRINGTQVSAVTGTGSVVLATSPTLVTPLLGTPTSGTLTNCTGLPVSTGISGLGTNVATFLATPSSANLASAVTDETGTGALVFANTPTLVTPVLGTPTSGTLTNCTGLPISTGVSGLGSNVATFLATPSSANLAAAVTDETGSGALVFGTSPTIATPTITTSAVIPLVNGGTAASSTLTLQSTSGTGTSDAILFKTGSQQERMRITTDGAVGIGVSPSYTFEVRDAGSNSSIAISNSGVTGELLSSITNATGVALISSLKQLSIGVSNAEPMVFKTSNSERMRILSTGEVGIGVTTANTRLHVSSDVSNTDGTGFDQGQLFVSDSSLDSSGLVLGYRYQSGVAEYARIQARSAVGATNIAMQAGGGNVGIGTSSPRSILNTYVGTITGPAVTAGLTLTANYSGVTAVNSIDWNYININASPVRLGATFNSDGVGMEMVFYTSTAYTVTGSERMRINKDGNVGIGTTPSYRLHVYNNADAVTSLVHLAKNNGGSADGVYILDDRGFSGVNSGKTFRVLTRDDGGNDTGAIASFESLSQTVLRVGIDGRVGVGTGAPATSAKLDIDSTTGALLVPRMTTTQRDALTAANGMIIYNTTTNTMQGRINGAWTDM